LGQFSAQINNERTGNGYAIRAYAAGDVIRQNGANNRRMAKKQYFALAMIGIGTLLQIPAAFIT
jgi:hypothetical protein